jgi:hypothetical protein
MPTNPVSGSPRPSVTDLDLGQATVDADEKAMPPGLRRGQVLAPGRAPPIDKAPGRDLDADRWQGEAENLVLRSFRPMYLESAQRRLRGTELQPACHA